MNPRRLMAVALCAAACVTTTAFAEDDFGIESASPVKIADPVNPQPGMVFNAYQKGSMPKDTMQESNSVLPKEAALKTGVDKGEKFSCDIAQGTNANVMRWEGFIKCKRKAIYTFVFQKSSQGLYGVNGYSVRINGQAAIPAGWDDSTCDVELKAGWNKVEIVCHFRSDSPLVASYKPKGSLSDPRPIAPKDLFHDQKPEEDW